MIEAKKILIFLTYYEPNISGLTNYAKILAESLNKNNNKVHIITSRFLKILKKNENVNGIEITRINGFRIKKGFLMPTYLLKVIKPISGSNIIFLHFPSIENVLVAVIGKILNKKIITIYHCKIKTNNWFFDWILGVWQKIGILLSEKIVVNSIDYLDGYGLLKNNRKKVVEILPPINLLKTNKSYLWGDKFIVGYLGRISKEKNIEILIEAAKKLGNNYMVILAGPTKAIGEDNYFEYILKKTKNINNIKIIGKIDNPVMFYNSIDCLVLPSNNELESFGMVSAEAIKCGCKAIVSDIPGVRMPVKITGFGDLFNPNSVDDLVNKIKINTQMKKVRNKNNKDYFKEEDFIYKYLQLLEY